MLVNVSLEKEYVSRVHRTIAFHRNHQRHTHTAIFTPTNKLRIYSLGQGLCSDCFDDRDSRQWFDVLD